MKDSTVNINKKKIQSNKELIYNAAKKLFKKNGYENTTVSDICKYTGLSVGTFYHYYKSKESILMLICKEVDVIGKLHKNVSVKAKDPFPHIYNYMIEYAAKWEEISVEIANQIYRIFSNVYLNEDFSFKDIKAYKTLEDFIKAAQDLNTLNKNMTPAEASLFIFTVGRGFLYEWCLRNGSYSLVDYTAKYLPFVLDIFKPEKE